MFTIAVVLGLFAVAAVWLASKMLTDMINNNLIVEWPGPFGLCFFGTALMIASLVFFYFHLPPLPTR